MYKKSQLKSVILFVLVIISIFIIGVFAVNETLNQSADTSRVNISNKSVESNLTQEQLEITRSLGTIAIDENLTQSINDSLVEIENNLIKEQLESNESVEIISINESLNQSVNDSIPSGLNQSIESNLTDKQLVINESLALIAINESLNQTSENHSDIVDTALNINKTSLNKTKPELAEFVNGESIHTEYYDNIYSKRFKLLEIEFQPIKEASTTTHLKIGNKMDWIKGFTINNENYAIHLVGCDREKITCNFRINGILVKGLSSRDSFDLNNDYVVKVNSITLDFCDNKLVCDYLFDSYDLIEIEILSNKK